MLPVHGAEERGDVARRLDAAFVAVEAVEIGHVGIVAAENGYRLAVSLLSGADAILRGGSWPGGVGGCAGCLASGAVAV